MKNEPHHEESLAHERLERLLDQTLRAQPELRAPASLEARVFARIEAQRARPWWRKSFTHWPMPARLMFVLSSVGLGKLAYMVSIWAMNYFNLGAASKTLGTSLVPEIAVARVAPTLVESILHSVPDVWWYAGIGGVVFLYVCFFGIGAFAYRTLYASR